MDIVEANWWGVRLHRDRGEKQMLVSLGTRGAIAHGDMIRTMGDILGCRVLAFAPKVGWVNLDDMPEPLTLEEMGLPPNP